MGAMPRNVRKPVGLLELLLDASVFMAPFPVTSCAATTYRIAGYFIGHMICS
jgi:hypothetical protein